MRLVALIALLILVALPAAAVAKGPHASLSAPGEAPQPGEPWTAALWVFEFETGKGPPPLVTARSGDERVTFDVTELSMLTSRHADVMRQARYRVRTVFPSTGPWLITVTPADPAVERFRFEPVQVGGAGATPVRDLLAIPGAAPARSTPLPPEVVAPPATTASNEDEPARLWIPLAGIALLAGVALVLRHRAAS